MVTLENDFLIVKIKPKGAELNSVFNKLTGLEYMWGGDPKVWGKTSPVLFPIVGQLKSNTYLYKEKSWSLPRHGFARDMEFVVDEESKTSATFSLTDSEASLQKYPFQFTLLVEYVLHDDSLQVLYRVKNNDDEPMYFSLGAHPAFKVPLIQGTLYNDYYLQFNHEENFMRWPISQEGTIETAPYQMQSDKSRINLTKELFAEDALVFKNLKSDVISIRSDKHGHGLDFGFSKFPFMGIWAAPQADFVCIEPWCGIADSVLHNQKLEMKEGINLLNKGDLWERSWKVKFY
jgi:galactose mutarotase-like enzyme